MLKLNFKKKNDLQWKHPSEGMHIAYVAAYLDPFEAETMKGDKYPASKYILEVVDEWLDDTKKDKHLTCLSKTLRLDSFHTKSNLYAFAVAALGKKEPKESDIDSLDSLVGKFVSIVVTHNSVTKDGVTKTYANVESVFACKNPPTDFKSTFTKQGEMTREATDAEIDEAIKAEKAEQAKLHGEAKADQNSAEVEKKFGEFFPDEKK